MGLFDQMKMAQEMMKNMTPEQIDGLMKQAKESQAMLNDQVLKIVSELVPRLVEEEIRKRQLVSRDELKKYIGAN